MRRWVAGACGLALIASAGAAQERGAQDYRARVERVLQRTPLIDGHNDWAEVLREREGEGRWTLDLREGLGTRPVPYNTDIARLRAGRVGGQFWSVYVDAALPGPEQVKQTLEQIDLVKAIGKKLGLEMEPETAAFETIIPSIGANFDLAISSFTINPERMQVVNFVSYYNAGTVWAVKKGGDIDPDDACGKKVAVQTGTVQDTDDLPAKNTACTSAGKPAIDIQKYDSQGDATTAVVTGKADAVLADLPVVVDAISNSNGDLEQAGEMYDAAPYGIALPKGNAGFSDAVLGALKSLQEDGTYDEILKKWSADEGALDDPQINPAA